MQKIYDDFLKTLYSEKASSDHILIWTAPDKISGFFTKIEDARNFVEEHIDENDVYFGVGTSPENFGAKHRCQATQISGIPGLYLDIDFAHPLHKKTNLPNNIEEAIELTKVGVLEPSMIISSGHGIQAYYLFDDFWHFSCDEERQKAAYLNKLFHEVVKAKAAEKEWTIDSVFDLSRVLRVPGSYNRKDVEDVKLVFVLEDNETTFSIEAIDNILNNLKPIPVKTQPMRIDRPATYIKDIQELSNSLVLNPSNGPDRDKFNDLRITFSDFMSDWENVKSGVIGDTSPSAFDMKMAIKAAQMNWNDQEICDLLLAHRAHIGHDQKLKNKQYYARTIVSSRAFVEKLIEKKLKAEVVEQDPDSEFEPEEILFDTKQEAYTSINARIGNGDIKIIEIIKYIEDPDPIYYMLAEFTDQSTNRLIRREILLGGVQVLLEYRLFKQRLAALTNKVLKPLKKDEWGSLSRVLMESVYERQVAPESTDIGQIQAWLTEYLRTKNPITPEEAYDTKEPFYTNNKWHFWRDKFYRWAKYSVGSTDTSRSFTLSIKRYGCEQQTIYFKDSTSGKLMHCAVWAVPPGFALRKE